MIITQTPLRVSLVGGATDIPKYYSKYGGEVLGFGIDKYLFVWIKERFDHRVIVNWTHKEVVNQVEEIQHELVREAASMAGLQSGFEVITTADIPSEGSGLGSSSALTVCLLNAFFQYRGIQLSTAELAHRACQIELQVLGKPMGKQDQYLSAFGGIQHIVFKQNDAVEVNPVKASTATIRLLNQNFLLFYTGITRKASDSLRVQLEQMDSTLEMYHQTKRMVSQVRKLIEIGGVDEIGQLLHEAWTIKKKFTSSVSLPQIDRMYDLAMKNGALGGKLCGAGGGGFLLVYCPVQKQDDLRRALSDYSEMPFSIDPLGSRSLLNVQRPMWKINL